MNDIDGSLLPWQSLQHVTELAIISTGILLEQPAPMPS